MKPFWVSAAGTTEEGSRHVGAPDVVATLALGNVAPQRLDCARVAPGELLITASLDGIAAVSAELILRKLQQLSIVIEATLSSEDRAARVRGPTA